MTGNVPAPETEASARKSFGALRPILGLFLIACASPVYPQTPAGPSAGAVLALAVLSGSPTVLAGTTAGGLYRSPDGGEHWVLAEGPLAGLSVAAVTVDPSEPSSMWAGTNGAGVFRSTDGGREWAESNTGLDNLFVEALVADPGPPKAVYAATDGGVFRSEDAGKSWKAVREGLTDSFTTALALAPGSGVLFVGTRGSGIFRLERGAARWKGGGTIRATVKAIAVHPSETGVLYAATQAGVFKSTDGGGGWSPTNAGLTSTSTLALAIDPDAPSRLYLSTVNGLFRSGSSGSDWARVETGAAGSFFGAVAIGRGSGTVLLGGEGAVVRSVDGGKTWNPVKLPPPPPPPEDEE